MTELFISRVFEEHVAPQRGAAWPPTRPTKQQQQQQRPCSPNGSSSSPSKLGSLPSINARNGVGGSSSMSSSSAAGSPPPPYSSSYGGGVGGGSSIGQPMSPSSLSSAAATAGTGGSSGIGPAAGANRCVGGCFGGVWVKVRGSWLGCSNTWRWYRRSNTEHTGLPLPPGFQYLDAAVFHLHFAHPPPPPRSPPLPAAWLHDKMGLLAASLSNWGMRTTTST
jgi:hypothetical protein